jgi:hypothetical protein
MKPPAINWQNPYRAGGTRWLKGSLHTHTSLSPCGHVALPEVLSLYKNKDYDFIALTDHNRVSGRVEAAGGPKVLAGIEADFKSSRHTCIVHPDRNKIRFRPGKSQQRLIDANVRRGCLVVLNHPDWQLREHYPIRTLLRLKRYSGIEIYNSVIERLEGSPLSTAKWDRLLSAGRRVLGFANQDFHRKDGFQDCCNVAHVRKEGIHDIFHALRTGNFYCHYGVRITGIGRVRNTVRVETENATLIRFIGNGGGIIRKVKSRNGVFHFSEAPDTPYVRIECLGKGEEISWSQPFFKNAYSTLLKHCYFN